ncbi:MAG: HesA/MoeB/ThiF family protein [Bacteroidales bacterium]
MENTLLNNQELRRYARQMMLPEIGPEGQEKLKKAKVLVAGAGGLGNPLMLYLAAAGIGEIGIADNDLVDESNLQRQILYGSMDLGKHKAIIAKERLTSLNHLNNYKLHVIFLNRENAPEICKPYDVLVDATDSFEAACALDDAARILSKPLVYGALHTWSAMVTVFRYNNSPGFSDLFPEELTPDNAARAKELGIPGGLPGIAGAIMATEVIKIITGVGTPIAGKLLIYNMLIPEVRLISYSK